jgi:hypothetical protein
MEAGCPFLAVCNYVQTQRPSGIARRHKSSVHQIMALKVRVDYMAEKTCLCYEGKLRKITQHEIMKIARTATPLKLHKNIL